MPSTAAVVAKQRSGLRAIVRTAAQRVAAFAAAEADRLRQILLSPGWTASFVVAFFSTQPTRFARIEAIARAGRLLAEVFVRRSATVTRGLLALSLDALLREVFAADCVRILALSHPAKSGLSKHAAQGVALGYQQICSASSFEARF